MTQRKRKTSEEHRADIIAAGLVDARAGLAAVTMRGVARRCGISHKQVAVCFENIETLRDVVAAAAIDGQYDSVIARLIADKHRVADAIPLDDRRRYVALLAD